MNELTPIFTHPVYANVLPLGMWMGTEVQFGADRYCQEMERDVYSFGTGNKNGIEAQKWISGMISFVSKMSLVDRFQVMPYPVINVSANLEQMPFPSVLNDGHVLGRMAAEHLINCGAESIHYIKFRRGQDGYRGQRTRGITLACEERGIPYTITLLPQQRNRDLFQKLHMQLGVCTEWLKEQSLPLALIAHSPLVGYVLADSIRQFGLTLGRDVALIQLTDPRESLRFCDTTVSYIAHDWRTVGYRAMELLVNWVEKGQQPPPVTWVPPLPPVLTPSSDSSHQSDMLTRFRSFLLHSDDYGLQVGDVASALGVSDSTLLRELKSATGLSVKDHLVQRQLREAKRLLRSTPLSVEEIARRCGYRVVHSLNAAFRKHEGIPPGEWRRREATLP